MNDGLTSYKKKETQALGMRRKKSTGLWEENGGQSVRSAKGNKHKRKKPGCDHEITVMGEFWQGGKTVNLQTGKN